jgi:hypothetical protein
MLYYVGPLLWGLLPRSKNPYSEVPADRFVAEYSKDPVGADDKFADRTIVVRGKLRVVQTKPTRRGQRVPPPKVYFDVPGEEKIQVECLFDDIDVASDLTSEMEYRIAGKVQRYKPGTPVTLRQAQVMAGQSRTAVRKREEIRYARNSSVDTLDIEKPEILDFTVSATEKVHIEQLKLFSVCLTCVRQVGLFSHPAWSNE